MSLSCSHDVRSPRVPRLARRCLLLAAGICACYADRAAGQKLSPDPVEEFRRALNNKEKDKDRKAFLEEKAKNLASLGDLSRALLLQDWRTDSADRVFSAADEAVQKEIWDKFEKKAKSLMAQPSANATAVLEKAATLYLIGETATAGRTLGPKTAFLRPLLVLLSPDMVRSTRDSSSRVREAAAVALGKIEPYSEKKAGRADIEEIVQALGKLLRGSEVGPRIAAATAMGNLVQAVAQQEKKLRVSKFNLEIRKDLFETDVRVVEQGSRGLAARQPLEVRRAIAEAFHNITAGMIDLIDVPVEDYQAIFGAFLKNADNLASASLDPDPGIRVRVRLVIEELAALRRRFNAPGDRPAPAPESKTTLEAVLNKVVGVLVAGLKDPDERGRLAALDALETLDTSIVERIPAIVRRLGDPNLFVRWAALRTLGRLAPAQPELVVPAVQKILAESDLDLRVMAARTLSRYGPEARGAVGDLALSVSHGDPEIRMAAMEALESIGTDAKPALKSVASALTHPNAPTRAAAARTLAHFGESAAFAQPRLQKALSDPDADVRKAASEALLKIHNQ